VEVSYWKKYFEFVPNGASKQITPRVNFFAYNRFVLTQIRDAQIPQTEVSKSSPFPLSLLFSVAFLLNYSKLELIPNRYKVLESRIIYDLLTRPSPATSTRISRTIINSDTAVHST